MKRLSVTIGGLVTAALVGACSGVIDTGSEGPGGSRAEDGTTSPAPSSGGSAPSSGGPAAGGPVGGAPAPGSCAPSPGTAPMRRLTRVEYDNTVRDLLGATGHPADAFQTDEAFAGFATNGTTATSRVAVERYMEAADKLAADAALPKLLPCDLAKGDDLCARAFIESFGRRAFRRPLGKDEVEGLFAFFAEKQKRAGFAQATRLVIAALLQSPSFLYRPDIALPTAPGGNLAGEAGYALATRLSYFIWASMPDEKLFAAAASGALGDRTRLETEVRRMLADPRATDAFRSFHTQWLGLSRLDTSTKEERLYPEWKAPLREAMKSETNRFIDDLFAAGGASFATLLTARHSFVDAQLGRLYGVANAPASGFARVELPPAERSGVLTSAAFLATQALPDQASPIHRGLFVRERLLCAPVPPPPSGVDITPPKVSDDASTRQRFEQHRADPSCKSCHQLFDPIGFGFQHYDGLGRYQTREGKDGRFAVDASGQINDVAPDVDGAFTGALELGARLAVSTTAQGCFARQWFRFGLGRPETSSEACLIDAVAARWKGAKLDVRELMVAIATSDVFRTRAGH